MTYVRVTRDQRGYETTFLLHARHPGDRPRVIYWYRTAPGVRVGRPAFDADVIRSLEEQHPEIEFDWDELLEEARVVTPEPERRPERRRRPAAREEAAAPTPQPAPHRLDDQDTETTAPREERRPDQPSAPAPASTVKEERSSAEHGDATAAVPPNPLLEQLVGREIAQRLRRRYREVAREVVGTPADAATQAAWQRRAEALDPDRWETPEAVLRGVEHSEQILEELRQELVRAQSA